LGTKIFLFLDIVRKQLVFFFLFFRSKKSFLGRKTKILKRETNVLSQYQIFPLYLEIISVDLILQIHF